MTANSQHGGGPPIYCGSEWHMRKNPRAHMIYSLALRITKGGRDNFYLSQTQLARYFNWNVKTVRKAQRALVKAGLFVLLRSGRGGYGRANFANVYSVLTHRKVAGLGTIQCWKMDRVLDADGMLVRATADHSGSKTGGKRW